MANSSPSEKDAPQAVVSNIRSVSEMETSLQRNRTLVDRIADLIGGFSGSMTFVFIHLAWFAAWFLLNTLPLGIKHFDPYPFILLAMIVSVEGVLLSTFVLMKQNRMQARIDVRDKLDLQINLLSEKEVTKSLQMLRLICEKLEIAAAIEGDPELTEMASVTSVDMLAKQVQDDLGQNR